MKHTLLSTASAIVFTVLLMGSLPSAAMAATAADFDQEVQQNILAQEAKSLEGLTGFERLVQEQYNALVREAWADLERQRAAYAKDPSQPVPPTAPTINENQLRLQAEGRARTITTNAQNTQAQYDLQQSQQQQADAMALQQAEAAAQTAARDAALKRVSDRAIAAGLSQQSYNAMMQRAAAEIISRETADIYKSSNNKLPAGYVHTTPGIDAELESIEQAAAKWGAKAGGETDPVVTKYETFASLQSLTQQTSQQADAASAKSRASNDALYAITLPAPGTAKALGSNGYMIDADGNIRDAQNRLVAKLVISGNERVLQSPDGRTLDYHTRDNLLAQIGLTGNAVTLALPALGETKALANGYTVNGEGVLKDAAGKTVAVLKENGTFVDASGKAVTADVANQYIALFNTGNGAGDLDTQTGGGKKTAYSQKNSYVAATDTGEMVAMDDDVAFTGSAGSGGSNNATTDEGTINSGVTAADLTADYNAAFEAHGAAKAAYVAAKRNGVTGTELTKLRTAWQTAERALTAAEKKLAPRRKAQSAHHESDSNAESAAADAKDPMGERRKSLIKQYDYKRCASTPCVSKVHPIVLEAYIDDMIAWQDRAVSECGATLSRGGDGISAPRGTVNLKGFRACTGLKPQLSDYEKGGSKYPEDRIQARGERNITGNADLDAYYAARDAWEEKAKTNCGTLTAGPAYDKCAGPAPSWSVYSKSSSINSKINGGIINNKQQLIIRSVADLELLPFWGSLDDAAKARYKTAAETSLTAGSTTISSRDYNVIFSGKDGI